MQTQPSTSILFFLGIVGLTLFGLGWAIDNDVSLPKPQELIEQLPLPLQASPQASPQAQVVVVPNSTPNQIVLPNGDLPQPVTIPQPATGPQPVTIPQPVTVPQPVILKEAQPAMSAANPNPAGHAVTVTATAQPIITVTATLQPIITVTATTKPVIIVTATPIPATATAAIATATSAAATVTAMNIVREPNCYEWKADHCAVWNTPVPSATAIPTLTQGPSPTPLPTATIGASPTATPWPTPTATATPENNEVSSIVTLQGETNHAGIIISAVGLGGLEWHELQVPGQAVTNETGSFTISGLSRGRYKLTAYTTTGTHIPACLELDLSGVGSLTIPQTMLSNGGLESSGDEDNLNLAAQAIFRHKFGLSIPEHLIPILDVSHDGLFDETDYNMIVADPSLMGCRDW